VVSRFSKYKLSGYDVLDAMLEAYHKFKTKLKTITKLKEELQDIWGNLLQGPIDEPAKDFSNYATEGLC